MKERIYVGLDPAETLGVAYYFPSQHKAYVEEVKGTPITQLRHLLASTHGMLGVGRVVFCLEQQYYYGGKGAIRSLFQRYGYLYWSLVEIEAEIRECPLDKVRKNLYVKNKEQTFDYFLPSYVGKKLTNNHTDALAAAIYAANNDLLEYQPETLCIEDIDGGVHA